MAPFVQVTDTPGLLYRPDEERNAMEKLTVATLEHLPTAALFVMDLTEECGCSVQQQWSLRTELLQRFPHKLWVDVISKADVLEEELDSTRELGHEPIPGVEATPRDATQVVCIPPPTGSFWGCIDYRACISWHQSVNCWLLSSTNSPDKPANFGASCRTSAAVDCALSARPAQDWLPDCRQVGAVFSHTWYTMDHPSWHTIKDAA
jgi:hypothetical protein